MHAVTPKFFELQPGRFAPNEGAKMSAGTFELPLAGRPDKIKQIDRSDVEFARQAPPERDGRARSI